jgi:hypothetical protein
MKLYVVSAINRLTGEREAVSAPRSYYRTWRLLQNWRKMTKDCPEPAWMELKVERYKDNIE